MASKNALVGERSATDYALALAEAVRPGAPIHRLTAGAEMLLMLAERGLAGDADSYAQYQTLLLDLHLPGERLTQPARRWLASLIYQVEDKFIPEVADFRPLSAEDFRARVDAEIAAMTRVRHPMSVHFYQGSPTHAEVKFFLQHHWIRSHDFYRLLAELAFRFEDIEDAAVFYRNLHGEAGGESAERSHPRLLANLMRYFDIPLQIDFQPLSPQEKAYLNNRIRCVRHPDIAWGLALLYAIESVSSTNHLRIYELLQRQGVPEGPCEFHRLHGAHDEIDTEELWELISKFSGSESFQRTFMRSLRRHFEINAVYFDVLWQELKGQTSLAAGA